MKYYFIAIIIGIFLTSCSSSNEQENNLEEELYEYSYASNKLHKKGVNKLNSIKSYSNPRSVIVDDENNILYVSNYSENIGGYITRVFLDGNIIDTLPIKTLTNPQGMVVVDQKLYITDNNHLAVYNLKNEKTENNIYIYNSQQLTDIEVDADYNIYISDSKLGCIYKMKNGTINIFIQDSTMTKANGLCKTDVNIAVGTENSIYIINPINGNKIKFAQIPFTPIGLKSHNDSIFIASDFIGNYYKITKQNCVKIINSKDSVCYSDFEYLVDQNLIFVPTYCNNTLDIYEIGF